MIKIDKLSRTIKDKKILDTINLNIPKGKVIGLVGPNGAGKTTLLHHIARLLKPQEGTITSSKSVSYFIGDDLGFDTVKVKSYISFMKKVFKDDLKVQLLDTILKDFKIPLDVKVKQLSRGEKVKLELAFVLSRDTDIYLLDEPFNGVDVVLRKFIIDNILQYIDIESKIIIISSHELVDIEAIIDDLIFIKEGTIQNFISIDDIKTKHNQSLIEYYYDIVNN